MHAILESSKVMAEIGARSRANGWRLCWLSSLLLALSTFSFALQEKDSTENPFPHYAAAQLHLAAGEEQQASIEFKLFLTGVLHSLASATAQTGHFDKAEPLFEEAVSLSPADVNLRMEYSRVLFNLAKFMQAKEQAQEAVRL